MLGFGHGQSCDHPKDGLYLYGPASPPERADISIGVVGTAAGIALLKKWLGAIQAAIPIPPRGKRDKPHRLHLSDFPGIEEGFGLRVDPDKLTAYAIEDSAVRAAVNVQNHHEAVSRTVDLFSRPLHPSCK
jgi:hypothetical protein